MKSKTVGLALFARGNLQPEEIIGTCTLQRHRRLELKPSVALQKKVGLKSLEQVIRWGDRVNQELRRWRKLEDRKCWRARARCIRKRFSLFSRSRLTPQVAELDSSNAALPTPF